MPAYISSSTSSRSSSEQESTTAYSTSSHTTYIDASTRAKVAALQRTAFLGLGPRDWPYLAQTVRLLALRDEAPELCAGEATVLMSDQSAPRCWRARAAVYRAEALMRLGFGFEARRALVDAGRMLNEPADADCHVQEDDEQRESYETLEALVAWNVAMGKINWGMVDGADEDNGIDGPIRSGPFLAAGWPLSHSLTALDLKWC